MKRWKRRIRCRILGAKPVAASNRRRNWRSEIHRTEASEVTSLAQSSMMRRVASSTTGSTGPRAAKRRSTRTPASRPRPTRSARPRSLVPATRPPAPITHQHRRCDRPAPRQGCRERLARDRDECARQPGWYQVRESPRSGMFAAQRCARRGQVRRSARRCHSGRCGTYTAPTRATPAGPTRR